MPIYEYECKNCGNITEALQSFSDPPLKNCEHCKKNKLEKLISLSSFKLEGTGWYATDYVKKPGIPPKAEDQKNPAVSDSNGKAGTGTTTVAESGGPSNPSETFKSIEKETKKAKAKAKSA